MAKSTRTYIYCYDEHRSFSEEVKKRFDDQTRYAVFSFHNIDDFMKSFVAEREHGFCKVAIIALLDIRENHKTTEQLVSEIKSVDRSTGILLLGSPDKIDEIKKVIRSNIDSYIPLNSNQLLRIHNTIKKLISEHSLHVYRKKRNFSIYFLLAYLAIAALLTVIACFRFPQYF
jgi:response regulator RpfG family c-di-GMP phosphodiesterase